MFLIFETKNPLRRSTRSCHFLPVMTPIVLRVGVLALQGAFVEHVKLLRQAVAQLRPESEASGHVNILEVRTAEELRGCDALIIPGGESTTVSLVAERSNLLEPLRHFVKYTPFSSHYWLALTSGRKGSS